MTQTETRPAAVVGLAALEQDRAARAIYAALALDGRIEPMPGGWPLVWRSRDDGDLDAVRAAHRLNDITAALATYRTPTPVSVAEVDGEPGYTRAGWACLISAALLLAGVLGFIAGRQWEFLHLTKLP